MLSLTPFVYAYYSATIAFIFDDAFAVFRHFLHLFLSICFDFIFALFDLFIDLFSFYLLPIDYFSLAIFFTLLFI